MNSEKAKRLNAVISAGMELVDDKTASIAPELYDRLTGEGRLIPNGTRINWNGTLKRAAVDLWDTPENTPDAAPGLWEDIDYKSGIRIIPEVITASLAFAKGELGWWKDVIYRSTMDANVFTPEQYPTGWEVVE